MSTTQRRRSIFTIGRAAVGISVALQVAEEYLSRFREFSIFGRILEPYLLDKAVHLGFFYGLTEIADQKLQKRIESKKLRKGLVFSLATAIGIGKELYDVYNGMYIDPLDLAANYAGTFYYFWRKRNER